MNKMNRILTALVFSLFSLSIMAGVDPASDDARFNGDRCYSFGDYETAVKYYERAISIDGSNVRALSRLGSMYKRGLGVKRNYKTALDWYMKAAATGDGSAIFNVGSFFLAGQGVKRNYPEAMKWFELASEKGCADAEYQMGCLYFAGTGVEQDYGQAVYWYQKAAEHRYLPALVNIGYMCCNGMGVVKDSAIGVQWYLYAAKYGSAEAMRNLGYCYMVGDGVEEQDEAKGLEWYQKAAALGDQPSKAYLRSIGKYVDPTEEYEEHPLVIGEDDAETDYDDAEVDSDAEADEFGDFHDDDDEEAPATFNDLPSVPEK